MASYHLQFSAHTLAALATSLLLADACSSSASIPYADAGTGGTTGSGSGSSTGSGSGTGSSTGSSSGTGSSTGSGSGTTSASASKSGAATSSGSGSGSKLRERRGRSVPDARVHRRRHLLCRFDHRGACVRGDLHVCRHHRVRRPFSMWRGHTGLSGDGRPHRRAAGQELPALCGGIHLDVLRGDLDVQPHAELHGDRSPAPVRGRQRLYGGHGKPKVLRRAQLPRLRPLARRDAR